MLMRSVSYYHCCYSTKDAITVAYTFLSNRNKTIRRTAEPATEPRDLLQSVINRKAEQGKYSLSATTSTLMFRKMIFKIRYKYGTPALNHIEVEPVWKND